jgi:hypothetical protein
MVKNEENINWARIKYSQIRGQIFLNSWLENLNDETEFRIYSSYPVILPML